MYVWKWIWQMYQEIGIHEISWVIQELIYNRGNFGRPSHKPKTCLYSVIFIVNPSGQLEAFVKEDQQQQVR